jgi:catechol 2,3-dioxygenase-like lactoylglutathione lyase family enzyme
VQDPDGVVLELFEDDPAREHRPSPAQQSCTVALRSITLSVGDVERSKAFFAGALSMHEAPSDVLHVPAMEALWGLGAAERTVAVLRAGAMLVELVQYLAPPGRPRPHDHVSSEIGVLNIAVGFGERATFRRAYRNVLDAGYASHGKPVDMGWYIVVYCIDDQGFVVELLYVHPWFNRFTGYSPRRD